MRIGLLRHGIAIDRDAPGAPSESQRHLTERGIQRTTMACAALPRLDFAPSKILSSPWLRARQTAELAATAVDLSTSDIQFHDELLWDAEPTALASVLAALQDTHSQVLCVGHAPHLDDFIAYMTGAPEAFTALKKAGLAVLDADSPGHGDSTLVALYPPRILRSVGAC